MFFVEFQFSNFFLKDDENFKFGIVMRVRSYMFLVAFVLSTFAFNHLLLAHYYM